MVMTSGKMGVYDPLCNGFHCELEYTAGFIGCLFVDRIPKNSLTEPSTLHSSKAARVTDESRSHACICNVGRSAANIGIGARPLSAITQAGSPCSFMSVCGLCRYHAGGRVLRFILLRLFERNTSPLLFVCVYVCVCEYLMKYCSC
jgi:hypothetical protein